MRTILRFIPTLSLPLLLLSCEQELQVSDPGLLVPRTVMEDASLPAITANGARLHAEAHGHPDSTLVICIHGGPGSDYRYMLRARDLADHGYRVVFYDQLGSGLSQRFPLEHYTSQGDSLLNLVYDELTDVIALHRTHASQKVYLLGHSWGGMLATAYVGQYPDAVQGVVAMEPGGLVWDDIVEYVGTSRSFGLWSEALNDAAWLDQFVAGDEDNHEIQDFRMGMLAAENEITAETNTDPASVWRQGAIMNAGMFTVGMEIEPNLTAGVRDFHIPVLFFYSERNQAYPDAWADRITSAYDTVQVIKVPGVGHSGIITDAHAWSTITLPAILTYFQSL